LATLSVQPAQQDGDSARVVTKVVACSGDNPQSGRTMSTGHNPSVKWWHNFVVTTVNQQKVSGRQGSNRALGR
jgi:hypothetical protein